MLCQDSVTIDTRYATEIFKNDQDKFTKISRGYRLVAESRDAHVQFGSHHDIMDSQFE